MNNDLIMQAIKLAEDVDEYAPNTNIAVVLRALILEIRELRKEKDELRKEKDELIMARSK